MAEIAVSCYGNLRAGARPIQTVTSGEHPHVIVQAVAHDLEKNVAIQIEKRRRIVGKKSKGGAIDEDDINLAVNACSAIAFRDAVFKVVPVALIRPVYEQAKRVAIGDVKSLGQKRGAVIDRLKAMGVTEDRILARVEARKVDDIDLSKLEILIGLGTALKDNEVSFEEAFPAPEAQIEKPMFSKPDSPKSGEPATPQPAGDSQPENPPTTPQPDLITQLGNLMLDNTITESALLKWAIENKHVAAGTTSVTKIPEAKLTLLVKNFSKIAAAINPPKTEGVQ